MGPGLFIAGPLSALGFRLSAEWSRQRQRGYSEVYRARDVKLGRDVALKILPEAFASDPGRLARFERALSPPIHVVINWTEELKARLPAR